VVDRRQPGEISGAIEPEGKTQIPRGRAGFFCALFAVLAVAPFHALAQDVSPQQDVSPPTGPATPTIASTWGGAPGLLAPAPSAALPFLLNGGGDLTAGHSSGSVGGRQPPFLLDGVIDLAEAYTTNAQGFATGQGGSATGPDVFNRGTVGLGAHYHGPRLTADFNYSLTGYYYDHFHDLNQLQNQFNLATTAQLVPNHLYFNLNAFATPATLSRVGPISAIQVAPSNTNNSNVYGYIAEPVLQTQFGEYATSQTSLTESQVFFSQPLPSSTGPAPLPFVPPGNSTITSAAERITSTPFFGRFAWDMNASYIDTQQTSETVQQRQATADVSYALDRWVAVLGTVGYSQWITSVALAQSLSGPILLGGAQLSYGPTFKLIAKAGVQNNYPTYQGSLLWDVTPTFDVIGSLTDAVTTTPQTILSNLSTLAVAPNGGFYNTQALCQLTPGQPLSPQPITSPVPALCLPLTNAITRNQNAQLAFVDHHDQRTTYALSFFGTSQDQVSVTPGTIQPNTWLYGASYNVTRQLRRDLSGFAGVSYSVASEFGGQDRIITANAGLTYNVAKHLDTYLTISYLQRQSTGEIVTTVPFVTNAPLTDFTTMIGVRRTFGH
jgi:uncharacterized protein (PEP-CTERM system associated)